MAMSPKVSRRLLAALAAGAPLFALGCRKTEREARSAFAVPPIRGGASVPKILILLPPEEQILTLVDSLGRELQMDFQVQHAVVRKGASPADIDRQIALHRPRLVVLINNPTAQAYGEWARSQSSPPAALVLLASFAAELVRTIPNAAAISWEVPVATSVQGLRGLGLDVGRVGVLYREGFAREVQRERELARPERAEFVIQQLDDHPSPREVKAAIVRLRRARVDALWIPNDNTLLSERLLTQVWAPYLRHFGAPVIVGVPSLVRGDMRLGSFATLPDLVSLGVQAADRVFDIADADWSVSSDIAMDVPLTVKSYLSKRAVADFAISEDRLAGIDFLVGQGGAQP